MRTVLTLLVLLYAASATANLEIKLWRKVGATQQEFTKDRAQCELESRHAAKGNELIYRVALRRCMEARGWRLKER